MMAQDMDYTGLVKAAGIKEKDTVDVVIDLFNVTKQCLINGVSFAPDRFIDALQEVITEEGNLLIRTFSWDWCHGKGYRSRETASQVGALGNAAMKRADFKRTLHPIYNWMVWGRDQDRLCNIDETDSFGPDSIFAWEENNPNAYQIDFGSPRVNGLTLFHYVEQKVGVPYRYTKNFTDDYEDAAGNTSVRTYSMYVRDLNYHIDTDDTVYNDELIKQGILKEYDYNGIGIASYKIRELCEVYEADIRKNTIPIGVTLSPINEEN